jgi:GNAT superfamily N-acetyltransferase
VPDPEILALEEAAFAAWPAAEVHALGPWRTRFTHGVTNRGNSAWLGPGSPAGGIESAVETVERAYRARTLAPMFQVMPFSGSPVDELLESRGYALHDPASLQIAEASRVARLPERAGAGCESSLSEAWFDVSGRRGRFRGEATDAYRGLLERLSGRAGFASACDASGRIAAVGLCVVAPPLAGISSMLTLPERRRGGLAQAVLGELARFARGRGAETLYLQVELGNAAALALYARCGFRESHRYHYRRHADRAGQLQ